MKYIRTKPIAVFYHCYLSGGTQPAQFDNAIRIIATQLDAMLVAGIVDVAQHFQIGVNGTVAEYAAVAGIAYPKCSVAHNLVGTAELPTMKLMQDFCKEHPGWTVLYLHTKGVIHNGAPVMELWRQCMEKTVIWNWQHCVHEIERGFDTAGAHWLTPSKYPFIGAVPYWGGNFFWASSDFLNTLPKIEVVADRYQAEVWIGKSPRRIKARDYAIHFPMSGCSA
jgi:hypothetical protein